MDKGERPSHFVFLVKTFLAGWDDDTGVVPVRGGEFLVAYMETERSSPTLSFREEKRPKYSGRFQGDCLHF